MSSYRHPVMITFLVKFTAYLLLEASSICFVRIWNSLDIVVLSNEQVVFLEGTGKILCRREN